MNKTWLTLILFVIGVIVYYGLLVVPPRISGKNIVLFMLYISASIYLLFRKEKEEREHKDKEKK